jgi:hypothetical protein
MMDKLERIDQCLRILRDVPEVATSQEELEAIRKVARAYLDAELGLSQGE